MGASGGLRRSLSRPDGDAVGADEGREARALDVLIDIAEDRRTDNATRARAARTILEHGREPVAEPGHTFRGVPE